MIKNIYLTVGVIFEVFILRQYQKDKVPYTKASIIIGSIIDIIAWPVVLLGNIMEWRR